MAEDPAWVSCDYLRRSENIKPLVSIIVPSYNRSDTIVRAIESVQAQTLADWELIVVDDGSSDNTIALIEGLEPRMNLIRQENRGFVEARNTGLRASTGKYVAFLDDDDELLPHHLELSVAFLEAFPDQQFVSSELLENFGNDRFVNHYRIETSEWYPQMARQIRSHAFDLPPQIDDDYLRVYETREPIGEWGREILRKAGIEGESYVYSGRIFEHLRWGYLISVNSTVLRRSVLDTVGLQDPVFNAAADYHFIATLCRNFRASFIGVPTYMKHELTSGGKLPVSGHLATGQTSLACAKDTLRSYETLFWHAKSDDPELLALRGLKQFSIAKTALRLGERDTALEYLAEARKSLPGFWRPTVLTWFVRCFRGAEMSRRAWLVLCKVSYTSNQLWRGRLTPEMFLRKVSTRIGFRNHYNGHALCLLILVVYGIHSPWQCRTRWRLWQRQRQTYQVECNRSRESLSAANL